MELLSSFSANPLRIYTVPKRIKNKKGISTFPAKHIVSHLDYSIDFSSQLNNGEVIINGKIICNRIELKINSSFFRQQSLTAFLSGGRESLSFYLTFIINTNQGNEFIQEMILPTYGFIADTNNNTNYKMIVFDTTSQIPNFAPSSNALAVNGYYFINNKNSYILV
ncbi:unnamed protein product [Commensalibacter communis]|uniref:Uncharacterized protein n=1 Tax=Commensalibacter communis TaxID=2972786 RepID=A0A9W4TQV9_9PROT|nr:hypothetical protein [Commensalibacter communis]CAI3956842.1 unnamed protein product [Commensalibacter communis]CAI3957938.1 unnamed protein product [Commensalibacter communis]CAI3959547.1 unnamed protein product [Commensalibacter communis]CAI3959858.1 unnamed protein product [Commensalibacter communis]